MAPLPKLTSRAATGLVAAVVPLALLSSCGGDDSKSGASFRDNVRPETPAEAYVAFAKAASSGDEKAFEDATLKRFHSDLGPQDATSFAASARDGSLVLPETTDAVTITTSTAFLKANDLGEEWLTSVSDSAGIADLKADAVAAVNVPDADQGEDVDIVILRDGADWRVWLIE